MSDHISICGNIGSDAARIPSPDGRTVVKFTVASSARMRDRETGEWVDGPASWFDVLVRGALGENAEASLVRGQRVVVAGQLRVKRWHRDERSGIAVEIQADAIGPDLRFGRATFQRTASSRQPEEASTQSVERAPAGDGEAWATPGEPPQRTAPPEEPPPASAPGEWDAIAVPEGGIELAETPF
ncbi:single-stranded DNA-binding protein [Microbacterium indicum]|uniref:single-stranded DNA-binding protein n=1 Tax=Microbacterium indicum TaxID=358100 RepID=UPI0006886683|nr:single-stranded DNA-binding protein [Microbacterium indicum]